jgi:UDP:flavonoid glycosyltransferase YjiC (YdhE family)
MQATEDQAMIRTAAEIGDKIRSENGVDNALSLIEDLMQRD